MKIEELITDANKVLYEDVASRYQVKLQAHRPGDSGWGSNVDSNIATVYWSPTGYAEESFAHELLHFDMQQKGYRRVRTAMSPDATLSAALPRIIGALDNEIQHHKMYPAFANMGYEAPKFYDDDDSSVGVQLFRVLNKPSQRLHDIAIDYLTAIAPGGTMSDTQREAFRDLFRKYDKGRFAAAFDRIDAVLQEWIVSESYDAEPFIKQFMSILTDKVVWINYTDTVKDFPASGYFVNGEFTIKQPKPSK